MLKRDYLQKQIEEFARLMEKVLREILALKNDGRVNEAYSLARKSLTDFFELDMENIIALSTSDFRKVILEANTANPAQLNYLAGLMFSAAELLQEKNESEKMKNLMRKSLLIYEHLDKTEKTYSAERQQRIEHIKKQLK